MSPADVQILRSVAGARDWSEAQRRAGRRVALVPTMGALHEGHLSLVRAARRRADRVVVSIFVNPTQFGANEDLDQYPRDLPGDVEKLRKVGVDAVFAPDVEAMYPSGDATRVEVGRLTERLCGTSRPGHFRGVATVVTRLLHACRPHVAVFGEKDWQQLAVIRRMVRDLLLDVEIAGAPIVREPDGVAMSSRNSNLSNSERVQARCLNAALHEARQLLRSGERRSGALLEAARLCIAKQPLATLDYAEICDPETLEPVATVSQRALLALAVHFPSARLIDNTVLDGPRPETR